MRGGCLHTAMAGSSAALAFALALASASADELVTVTSTRLDTAGNNITVKTLVLTPPLPAKGTVILLPGGDGWLDVVDATGQPGARLDGNFLVRTRTGLKGLGFRTVLVDAPSDRQNATGLTGGFRFTQDHAKDLAAVVKRFVPDRFVTITIPTFPGWPPLTIQFPNPDPWSQVPGAVIGTSAGSASAALAAFQPGTLAKNPDVAGVALTAAQTSGFDSINSFPINLIKQPVLFVHHVNDGCASAPYIGASGAAFGLMEAGIDVSFGEINGGPGPNPDPDPCQGGTLHGFARAGAPALDMIKKWMLTLKR